MTTTYPVFYGSQRVTMEQLERKSTVANCHPEFRRRMLALIAASGGRLGVGTAWRSPAAQDAEYARRQHLRAQGHHPAAMTPSSRSWHCAGAAVDFVGDLHWAAEHCEAYGLYKATWGGESWHFQPTGLPHARHTNANPNDYIGHFEILRSAPPPVDRQPAPGTPPFDPAAGQFSLWPLNQHKEPVRMGSHGDAVKYLQGVLVRKGNSMPVDGSYGPTTARTVRGVQRFFHLAVDGKVGHQTWPYIDLMATT